MGRNISGSAIVELDPKTDAQVRDVVERLASREVADERIIEQAVAELSGHDALENELIEQAAIGYLAVVVRPAPLERAA